MQHEADTEVADRDFLSGGGELASLIKAHPWSETALGPVESWPRSLKTAVRIMLTSRQPIWIGWGKELVYLYNDSYKSIIGGKHPWALGKPTSQVWAEIWDDIGHMLETAMGGTEGTYVEEQLLIMERNGYPEETYYTFSYSPVPDDRGVPGGIICANTDDTQRVIGERQIALLREQAAGTADSRSWLEAGVRSAAALATNPKDLPFALVYIEDVHGGQLTLAGSCGFEGEHPAAPSTLPRTADAPWPVRTALNGGELCIIDLQADLFAAPLPVGGWAIAPSKAVVAPILPAGEEGRAGLLVVGLNPFRLFDESYRGFLELVSRQIAAAIASAEAYEEERRRAEALAEIDRAKTLFFSNVSHEFRTPLTLMLGPLEEALNDQDLTPQDRHRLTVAHRNGRRLLKLVNTLLDFSRIEAGRVEAKFETTDVSELTADLVSNFRSATERAGLYLRVDCPSPPTVADVDRDMWEKIVLNLVSNAFKFTFEGGIDVSVRTADGEAVLTVSDTGTGIPEKELPRIFDRFHRVENSRGRSFEGSGIGLALVNELVKLHGGVIGVESCEGKGTRFTVCVPLARSGAARAPTQSRPPTADGAGAIRADAYVEEALRWLPDSELPGDSGSGPDSLRDGSASAEGAASEGAARILVVDDNADMRDYVCRLLGPLHQVEAASDGQQAIELMRSRLPDLVLTDIMMPKVDGFALLGEIRRNPEWREVPVIVLSARAGTEARAEGLSAGADDYLVKPFSARELIARVNGALTMAAIRRQTNEALRESEARFRNMADHAPVMIWTTDPTGACTYLSRSWYDFTGQTPETGIGFGWLDATHPADKDEAERLFAAANDRREPFALEYRLRHRSGEYRWAVDAAAPWFDGNGEFRGYIGSVIDITERKNAEEAQRRLNAELEMRVAEAVSERKKAERDLVRAQKLDAIGKLTGGVAHDFNNLLQVIAGNLQLLEKDFAGHGQALQRLHNAIAGVSRGAKLASQLLAFGRRQPLAPKVVNLGRLVRDLDEIFRRTLGEQIEVETVIAAGLWNTNVDPSQVENALLNLAINARDAMKGHGKLTIEAGNAYLDDQYALEYQLPSGQYVVLAVTDTGCGMSPEVLDQAFEPFFTTKKEGEGTGLGLSMVYGFVKQSGGHIKIYSEVDQGTTVRIYLPRVRQEEDAHSDMRSLPVIGGSETVLVVEDDEEVRNIVVDMLSELGYRVLRAKDASSAFAIVESGNNVDLLFTDVVMPGPMRSTELVRRVRRRSPRTAILFTSGYTDNAIVHSGKLDEGVELLSKPYSRETLARKVRHVLRNHQQALAAKSSEPRAAGPADRAARTRGLRVLAVEDDPLILMSTTEMLAELGHECIEATRAEQALAALETRTIDVLLTDIGLPDMTGTELALEALRLRPEIGVVFATGYSSADVTRSEEGLAAAVLLPKPYDGPALSAAIEEAIRQ